MSERLQKVLAEAGIASRRKCEEIIAAGRVQVNGETVNTLGVKVDPSQDEITVDGRPVNLERKVYLMLHKPKGVITSAADPAGRKVVGDYLPGIKERVYPIGRLDYDTEGLLLLTNDGDFANLLTHPRHHVPRTYLATVKGTPHGSLLEKLQNGVELEDGMTAPAEVDYHDVNPEKNESVIKITIYEGRNRQVRRMFDAISFPVIRLKRVQFGPLTLGGLPRGKYRLLAPDEVKELRDSALKLAGRAGEIGDERYVETPAPKAKRAVRPAAPGAKRGPAAGAAAASRGAVGRAKAAGARGAGQAAAGRGAAGRAKPAAPEGGARQRGGRLGKAGEAWSNSPRTGSGRPRPGGSRTGAPKGQTSSAKKTTGRPGPKTHKFQKGR